MAQGLIQLGFQVGIRVISLMGKLHVAILPDDDQGRNVANRTLADPVALPCHLVKVMETQRVDTKALQRLGSSKCFCCAIYQNWPE